MRPFRNHRRGPSYLTDIAQSAVRPFHYRNNARRLLARSSGNNMGHKNGAYTLLGEFKYLMHGHGYDSELSEPPFNTGYINHNQNNLKERFSSSFKSENHIQLSQDNQQTESGRSRDNVDRESTESRQRFTVYDADVSDSLSVGNRLDIGNKATLPLSSVNHDVVNINQKSSAQNNSRISNYDVAPVSMSKWNGSGTVQQGQTLDQLLGALGKQLEEYNYGDSDEASDSSQQINPSRSISNDTERFDGNNISIPGVTTRKYVDSIKNNNRVPEFVESKHDYPRIGNVDNTVIRPVNNQNAAYGDMSFMDDYDSLLLQADIVKPANNTKFRQRFYDSAENVDRMDMKYLMNNKFTGLQQTDTDKHERHDNKKTKKARHIKTITIKKPARRKATAERNYLQRRYVGNSRIRVYK